MKPGSILKQEITEHMKAAMRSGDTKRRDAIRLLQAAIKQREVDERIEMNDAMVIAVIEKMIKQRKDSITQYVAAKREDLADIERYEVGVLQAYMPKALNDSEIESIVEEVISLIGAKKPQEMGKVIAALRPKLAGRADMGKVAALVKSRLII
ncbi:GatB/YqeY domain-containing protein [Nitrosomonadaceae bacterium]|nr:GatB/YqeY domain-containing protein [Nitrosomonadaceae bacterium]